MAVFDPYRFASGLSVKNRLVVAPMTTWSSLPDGQIDPEELPYLRRRAEGGFGTVMTAACCVHPTGMAFHGQWACWDDRFLPSLKAVADEIHAGGAAAVLQIHHGGRQCPPELVHGRPLSASAIASPRANAVVPEEMTEEEVQTMIRAFAEAAARGREAGYDGIEIHGANTYLLQQFVSPHSNRRTDAWGEDRLRFSLAVTDAVLAAVPGFSVGYRFSPEEPETPGLRMADTERLIDALCERPLDFLHISLRDYRQGSLHEEYEGSTLDHVVRYIKGRLPLIGVGSVKTLADAEAVLTMGAELVAIGRVAISEPEWPQRAVEGTVRHRVPVRDLGTVLTVPRGLAEKIEGTPGWFEAEEE